MREEHICDALHLLNDDILEETSQLRCQKKSPRRIWIWTAATACLVLVLCAIGQLAWKEPVAQKPTDPIQKETVLQESADSNQGEPDLSEPTTPDQGEEPQELPMIAVTEYSGLDGSFEGLMAYDISEIVNGNPWNESIKFSTLPVYKNQLEYDRSLVKNIDLEKMKSFLLSLADRFNMDKLTGEDIREEKSFVDPDVPKGYSEPINMIAENKEISIEVDTAMTATISFDSAISLPKEYHFTHHASYEDKMAVAGYLQEAYKDWIAMEDPKINIHGGDYDYDLNQQYDIEFYDGSGDITGQIINYNFNRIAFYCDGGGKLDLVKVFKPDLSGKVGDYPIISTKKAAKLLSKGHYITTVPYEMPGEKYIARTELVYRTGDYEEYYMPYYRFLVELPETDVIVSKGIKTYGAYYVPAVEKAYISNMPLWKGRFN